MGIRILEVESLNLKSKKDDIKKMIINGYANLLNSLQIPIQIICKSEKYDITKYKIKDSNLHEYIKKYTSENNIVNKSFYVVMSHKNNLLLNSNIDIIKRYFKSMNIHFNEVKEGYNYKWDNILSMTKTYVKDELYYYKTLWVYDWPFSCSAGWLDFLYNTDLNIDINCFINPQNTFKSIKYLKRQLLLLDVNSEMEEERTSDDEAFSAEIQSTKMMLKELRSNSGKLFLSSFYISVKGETPIKLQENYMLIKNLLSSKGILCHDSYLYQHRSYLNNSFIGRDSLDKIYNFTTSSLKCFFPFQANNICDKDGIYVAQNIENKNLIFLDIFAREYAVLLILGIMGSGKSFLAKNLIKNLADLGVEITILDKSGEYMIFDSEENIIVHSKKTMHEYLNITKKYVDVINNDYINKRSKPRLFLTDELWSYINNNNEYCEQMSYLFDELILDGRKKYVATCFISQLIKSLAASTAGQTIMKAANIRFLMKMLPNEARIVANEFYLNKQQENFLSTVEYEGLLLVNSNCVEFKVETTDERKSIYNTNPRYMEENVI